LLTDSISGELGHIHNDDDDFAQGECGGIWRLLDCVKYE
jgi:hypothetical protein